MNSDSADVDFWSVSEHGYVNRIVWVSCIMLHHELEAQRHQMGNLIANAHMHEQVLVA